MRLPACFRRDFVIPAERIPRTWRYGWPPDSRPLPIRNRCVAPDLSRGHGTSESAALRLQQAQARLTAMAAEIRHDFPADYPAEGQWTIEIQPLQEDLVGKVRPMLLVLLGAVILIVLIVSLNIANLF